MIVLNGMLGRYQNHLIGVFLFPDLAKLNHKVFEAELSALTDCAFYAFDDSGITSLDQGGAMTFFLDTVLHFPNYSDFWSTRVPPIEFFFF